VKSNKAGQVCDSPQATPVFFVFDSRRNTTKQASQSVQVRNTRVAHNKISLDYFDFLTSRSAARGKYTIENEKQPVPVYLLLSSRRKTSRRYLCS
jgi:hypothetical protein